MTQAEVAREVGLSARGYQDLELGAKPGFDSLLHIADFFDVSADWLMDRTEDPHAHRRKTRLFHDRIPRRTI